VGLGSLDVIAEHAGPLLAKDVSLFSREPAGGAPEGRAMLAAADRFLELVGRPRRADGDDDQEASG